MFKRRIDWVCVAASAMLTVGTPMAVRVDRCHRAIGRRTTLGRKAATVPTMAVVKLGDKLLWERLHILWTNGASAGHLKASSGW
jgi:hypothetical protein